MTDAGGVGQQPPIPGGLVPKPLRDPVSKEGVN
jgi:hypothetical protein